MASINIFELRPAGSELFQDSESFLNELSDAREMDMVLGGAKARFATARAEVNTQATVISQLTISIGASIVSASVVSQLDKFKKRR